MASTEFDLIYRYFSALGRGPAVALSVGDDAALLQLPPGQQLVCSVDTQLPAVHFPADTFPEDIAFHAVAAAASDLAAMGADPVAMTIALTIPDPEALWLQTFSEGLAQAVALFALPLVGGDTTRGPLAVSVQVMGAVPAGQALLRSGARAGDRLVVSGNPGDAAAGLALLQESLVAPAAAAATLCQRFLRPPSRLALGAALRGVASAAIDISDGLLADAGHLAAASGVRLNIDVSDLPLSAALRAAVPVEQARRYALGGGDDYELLFTLPEAAALPTDCTVIGHVAQGSGVHGAEQIDTPAGYRHF